MSPNAQIRSHRKPRSSNPATKWVVRAGITGGALTTMVTTGAAAPALGDKAPAGASETTAQIPAIPVADAVTAPAERTAEATEQAALKYALQAEQSDAAQDARKAAAEAKEKAEKKAKAEAARKAAAEREAKQTASRSSERTTLAAPASNGSGSVATVVSFMKAQLGDAYVMGASGPDSWDCSSLVQAAFKQAGVDLPRVSQDQSTVGTEVGTSNLQVGDILYWGGKGSAYHTGVYIGGGQYLDAANPSKGVVIQDLSGYPADGAVRVL
ncbi:glycoside hydrolase [Streptomyces sp. A7024]|uniref:Glycoside hydrolase n=1 Tax=Streptomyces coryli TaxID=1128680 RepID=A0A6G4U3X9_9ACTN|nr:C40 family peptidase [Streptomyces coryli]NGN65931.1 glycoside hydrolase [Streptomyces coryli]